MAITQTFSQKTISGTSLNNPTSLQIGPDGKLYVSQQNGLIKSYDLSLVGENWSASNEQTINSINQIPNHNDDGSLSTQNNRQVTGILVEGTATNPIIYVSSSDPRIGAGGSGNDKNLDTNSGILSRLTWNGSSWDKVDLVIGLPRSEENHSTNGLDIRTESVDVGGGVFEDRQIMYVASGGHANKGAPSNNFAWTPEYYYSAAVLRVDLTELEQIEANLLSNGGLKGGTSYVDSYVYALPTLDDPTRSNDANGNDVAVGTTGAADAEAGGTFGGNDGRNQAKFDPGGPVQIYSPGYRNHYDVAITENGNIYTFDNGPNAGWGDEPIDQNNDAVVSSTQSATNRPDSLSNNGTDPTNNDGAPDRLHLVTEGHYGGHANPTRASGADAELYAGIQTTDQGTAITFETQLTANNSTPTLLDDLPPDWNTITGNNTNPEEGVWLSPNEDGSLLTIGSSSNGLTEYVADGIGDGGVGTEYLAVASFNGNVTLIEIATDGTQAGTAVTDTEAINVGGTPLDITALGNSGIPGSNGLGAGALLVAKFGADNIVVLEPGTPPMPPNDADSDGILDKTDPLQFDPNNGTATELIGGETLFWDFNPANGNYPGSDDNTGVAGEYNIGLTGWMVNGVDEINPDLNSTLLTDLDNTIRGGAPGVFQIKSVTEGDAFLNNNSQQDAIQTGFLPAANVKDFTIAVPTLNLYSSDANDGVDFTGFGSMGIALGTGDQSNYIKFVVGADNNGPRLQVLHEEGDGIVSNQTATNIAALLPPNTVDEDQIELGFKVDMTDPQAVTVQAQYRFTQNNASLSGAPITVGNPITLATSSPIAQALRGEYTVEDQPSAPVVTLLATSTGPQVPFVADFLELTITATESSVSPNAQDDIQTTSVNQILNIPVSELLANDSDLNGDPLTITSVTNGTGGTVLLDNNGTTDSSDDEVVFTPITNFTGAADFTYTLSDNDPNTANDTAQVTVNVIDEVVFYRVNAGGPLITALDDGPNWVADTGSFLADPGSNNTAGFSVLPGSTVPATTPAGIFQTERWDQVGGTEMQWEFETLVPGFYEVRLYMGNGFGGTSAPGQRVFDVEIEGNLFSNLDDIDLSATFGHQVGAMVSNVVSVTDGTLDIDFLHGVENPLINGIEVIQLASSSLDPTVSIISGSSTVPESGQVQISLATDFAVPTNETVTVEFEIVPGTATPGVDYAYGNGVFDSSTGIYTGSIAIAGSSSDATFNIDILPDMNPEADETFTVNITGVSANAQIGVDSATITIDDNDTVFPPGTVVYRINAGGAEVAATDGGPAWTADQSAVDANGSAQLGTPSIYLVDRGVTGDDITYGFQESAPSEAGLNATEAPDALFLTERFGTLANPNNIGYAFEVPNGDYTVNLYFDEIFFAASGERSFDVQIEDVLVLDDFDTYGAYGNNTGVESFSTTVTDTLLNIEFLQGAVNNPHIAAIEVIAADGNPYMPPLDDLFGAAVEISGDRLNPTDAGLLTLDNTVVTATQEGESGENNFRDRDIFTVTIPDGFILTGIELTDYVNNNPLLAQGFLGIQSGNQLTVDVETGAPDPGTDGLLGGIVYNSGYIGQDLLDIMALGGEIQPGSGLNLDQFTPALTGDVTVWLNQGAGPGTPTLNFILEEIPPQPGDIVAAINAGGPALIQDGIDFSADQFFDNGNVFTDGNAGNGNQPIFDGTVYETERYGGASGSAPLSYAIPVSSGDYTVELYFAEIFQSNPSTRVFDVFIEDQLVLDDFDILVENGNDINAPLMIPLQGTFSPSTAGAANELDISFSASVDNAKISGIVVRNAESVNPISIVSIVPPIVTTVEETGDTGVTTLEFPITFDIAPTSDVTVEYSVEINGIVSSGTQSLGTTNGVIAVDVANDDIANGPESITVTLTGITVGDDVADLGTTVASATVTEDDAVGSALVTVTLDGVDVQASNFGANSFVVTNTGDKDIASVEIDITNALYPDSVFDPFGVAGDTIGKVLTINTPGSTGIDAPNNDPNDPGNETYIGAGGSTGFEAIKLTFDSNTDGGFNSNETLGFSVDMDPNSIAGAVKSILDSGADPDWDIGGVSGAELIGSEVTVTFTDGTTAMGQLQGAGNQAGAQAVASQDLPNLPVTLMVNGLSAGEVGTYSEGGPSVIINGPDGAVARVVLTKGIIQPVTNNFTGAFQTQLDAQLDALRDSDFPANNAAEFQTVDIMLDGTAQDISNLFDFTQVPGFELAVDEAQVPLGFVAGLVDFSDDNDSANDLPIGPVTQPIYLAYDAAPTAVLAQPLGNIAIETPEAQLIQVTFADDMDLDEASIDGDEIQVTDALGNSLTVNLDSFDGTTATYTVTPPGGIWDISDNGAYSVEVLAGSAADTTGNAIALTPLGSFNVAIPDGTMTGSAIVSVTLDGTDVQSSNFGANSFLVTNTGDKDIASVEIDVTNALYPDSVFDPYGVAGDTIGKLLSIDSSGGTGVDTPNNDPNDPGNNTYIGLGGTAGFEAIKLTFDPNTDGGFNPNETLGFSVDMDPNSIAGAVKSVLDSGADPVWDIGGISGAELIGSEVTITFTDGTTATGQLQGAGNQAGAQALASQASSNLPVTLTVNGLSAGEVGTYSNGGPSVIINGPANETARVVLTKGIIQPVTNEFFNGNGSQQAYAPILQSQLDALAASDFPANNAAEFQTVDILLDGTDQDISSLFDFTQVPNYTLAVDESQVPLGFVAGLVDFSDDNNSTNDLPSGPVTSPIYLQYAALNLTVDETSLSENGGVATATLTRNTDPTEDLIVTINSSDTSEAIVPQTVTIPAGSTSVTFEITAVDDGIVDGSQLVTVTASATELGDGVAELTITDDEAPSSFLLTLNQNTSLNGLSVMTQDIALFDGSNYSLFFDGSDVGVDPGKINAFDVISETEIFLSFDSTVTLPGLGSVDEFDVVKFTATSLGENTAGTFSLYFDGSDLGFNNGGEDIDALMLLPDGDLLLSVLGKLNPGNGVLAENEDLVRFTPTSLGADTTGGLSVFFDGSDVGLADEAIDGFSTSTEGIFFLSLSNDFAVNGISGKDEDVFIFNSTATGDTSTGSFASQLFFDGSEAGLQYRDVHGLDFTFTDFSTPESLSLNLSPLSISEDEGFSTATISRTGDTSAALTVFLSSDDLTEATVNDMVTIAAGETSTTFTVSAVDDTDLDGTQIATITATATGFTGTSAALEVTDNEVPPTSLSVSLSPQSISENGGVSTATVTRTGDISSAVTVTLASSDLSEATVTQETMIIDAGQSFTTFQVSAVDDTAVDGSQTATLTATASGLVSGSADLTVTDDEVPPTPQGTLLTLNSGTTLGDQSITTQDIAQFDGSNYSLFFDGSDVSLTSGKINAFDAISANEILMSFESAVTLPGVGTVDDSDIVLFTATSLGETTAGTFSIYFDGSDVGLSNGGEDIDALTGLSDDSLLISVNGNLKPGSSVIATGEDVVHFTPTALGDDTAGDFTVWTDGSDIGFAGNVDAFSVDASGDFYFSFADAFVIDGVTGDDEDIVSFTPGSTGEATSGTVNSPLFLDGSDVGLQFRDVLGVDVTFNN